MVWSKVLEVYDQFVEDTFAKFDLAGGFPPLLYEAGHSDRALYPIGHLLISTVG
jgi:hypothetical protein